MATILNDRDVLLQGTSPRNTDPTAGKALVLAPDSPVFKVSTSGVGTPSSITITAKLIDIKPPVSWSVLSGASGVTPSGDTKSATLAYASMTANSATIQAQVAYLGQTYTQTIVIQKVFDGTPGSPGADALNTALVTIYKRSASGPSVPSGTLTYTFSTASLSGSGQDGWTQYVPGGSDPVYVSTYLATGYGSSVTISSGSWATPVVMAQNGTNGSPGTNGVRGTVQTSASGHTSWSDSAAAAAIVALTGTNYRQMDVVTLYGSGFSQTRYVTADYPGGSWILLQNYLSGNTLVNGTLAAAALIADDFSGYTFTGNTFRTAPSGARIVIDYSANNFVHYDSGGNSRVTIGGGSGSIYVTTAPAAVPGIYCTLSSSAPAISGWNGSTGYGIEAINTSSGNTALRVSGRISTQQLSGTNGQAIFNGIAPVADNTFNCGEGSNRWGTVYAATGTINTSDEREKDFFNLDQGLNLVLAWRPIKYKWKIAGFVVEDDADFEGPWRPGEMPTKLVAKPGVRWHYGFSAQQIRSTLEEDVGLHILTDKDDPQSRQGLRHDEMLAPMVRAIQQLSAKIDEQAATISALQQELTELRNG